MKRPQHYNINLDRLEITYTASEDFRKYLEDRDEAIFDGCLRLIRKDPQKYHHEFAVWCTGENPTEFDTLMGYLYFGSPNPNRPDFYFSFTNESLYNDFLLASRFYLEEAMPLSFKQISKIDIAVDFSFNIVRELYRLYKDETCVLLVNGRTIGSMDERVAAVVHIAGDNTRKRPLANPSFNIDNKDHSLTFKAYNKTKEIDDNSKKEYIRDNAGFNRLYRLEVSCGNHKMLKKSLESLEMREDDVYGLLQDEKTLRHIFIDFLNRLIRYRQKPNMRKPRCILEYLLKDVE